MSQGNGWGTWLASAAKSAVTEVKSFGKDYLDSVTSIDDEVAEVEAQLGVKPQRQDVGQKKEAVDGAGTERSGGANINIVAQVGSNNNSQKKSTTAGEDDSGWGEWDDAGGETATGGWEVKKKPLVSKKKKEIAAEATTETRNVSGVASGSVSQIDDPKKTALSTSAEAGGWGEWDEEAEDIGVPQVSAPPPPAKAANNKLTHHADPAIKEGLASSLVGEERNKEEATNVRVPVKVLLSKKKIASPVASGAPSALSGKLGSAGAKKKQGLGLGLGGGKSKLGGSKQSMDSTDSSLNTSMVTPQSPTTEEGGRAPLQRQESGSGSGFQATGGILGLGIGALTSVVTQGADLALQMMPHEEETPNAAQSSKNGARVPSSGVASTTALEEEVGLTKQQQQQQQQEKGEEESSLHSLRGEMPPKLPKSPVHKSEVGVQMKVATTSTVTAHRQQEPPLDRLRSARGRLQLNRKENPTQYVSSSAAVMTTLEDILDPLQLAEFDFDDTEIAETVSWVGTTTLGKRLVAARELALAGSLTDSQGEPLTPDQLAVGSRIEDLPRDAVDAANQVADVLLEEFFVAFASSHSGATAPAAGPPPSCDEWFKHNVATGEGGGVEETARNTVAVITFALCEMTTGSKLLSDAVQECWMWAKRTEQGKAKIKSIKERSLAARGECYVASTDAAARLEEALECILVLFPLAESNSTTTTTTTATTTTATTTTTTATIDNVMIVKDDEGEEVKGERLEVSADAGTAVVASAGTAEASGSQHSGSEGELTPNRTTTVAFDEEETEQQCASEAIISTAVAAAAMGDGNATGLTSPPEGCGLSIFAPPSTPASTPYLCAGMSASQEVSKDSSGVAATVVMQTPPESPISIGGGGQLTAPAHGVKILAEPSAFSGSGVAGGSLMKPPMMVVLQHTPGGSLGGSNNSSPLAVAAGRHGVASTTTAASSDLHSPPAIGGGGGFTSSSGDATPGSIFSPPQGPQVPPSTPSNNHPLEELAEGDIERIERHSVSPTARRKYHSSGDEEAEASKEWSANNSLSGVYFGNSGERAAVPATPPTTPALHRQHLQEREILQQVDTPLRRRFSEDGSVSPSCSPQRAPPSTPAAMHQLPALDEAEIHHLEEAAAAARSSNGRDGLDSSSSDPHSDSRSTIVSHAETMVPAHGSPLHASSSRDLLPSNSGSSAMNWGASPLSGTMPLVPPSTPAVRGSTTPQIMSSPPMVMGGSEMFLTQSSSSSSSLVAVRRGTPNAARRSNSGVHSLNASILQSPASPYSDEPTTLSSSDIVTPLLRATTPSNNSMFSPPGAPPSTPSALQPLRALDEAEIGELEATVDNDVNPLGATPTTTGTPLSRSIIVPQAPPGTPQLAAVENSSNMRTTTTTVMGWHNSTQQHVTAAAADESPTDRVEETRMDSSLAEYETGRVGRRTTMPPSSQQDDGIIDVAPVVGEERDVSNEASRPSEKKKRRVSH